MCLKASSAGQRINAPAGRSRARAKASPARKVEKSGRPCRSASVRNGAREAIASGKAGTLKLESSSCVSRLTKARAGRSVNTFVATVGPAPRSAAQFRTGVAASGESRNAVPICTPAAPSARTAVIPCPSPIPPAATTGSWIALATAEIRVFVPSWAASSSRKVTRCPPASLPWAITASAPFASSQSASATVVAHDRTLQPAARTRSSSSRSGSPKWKLITCGLVCSTTSHSADPKGGRSTGGDVKSCGRPRSGLPNAPV